MSDIVLVSLIAAVPGTLGALGILLNIGISITHDRRSNQRKDALDDKISSVVTKVGEIEKNTNSLTEKLVARSETVAFQAGGDAARADIKIGVDSEKREK